MLTGDELRAAREAAHMTQQQVADRVDKTLRSVGNWERAAAVPRSAEARIRAAFPEWFGQPAAPLSSVSDAQLLAEIARRFDRGRAEDGEGSGQQPAPRTQAGDARDQDDTVGQERQASTRLFNPYVTRRDPSPPQDAAADEGPAQPGFDDQRPEEQEEDS